MQTQNNSQTIQELVDIAIEKNNRVRLNAAAVNNMLAEIAKRLDPTRPVQLELF